MEDDADTFMELRAARPAVKIWLDILHGVEPTLIVEDDRAISDSLCNMSRRNKYNLGHQYELNALVRLLNPLPGALPGATSCVRAC